MLIFLVSPCFLPRLTSTPIHLADDPYFALNFGPYGTSPVGAKEENDPKVSEEKRNEIFIAALGRSYLKEDTEGVSHPGTPLILVCTRG